MVGRDKKIFEDVAPIFCDLGAALKDIQFFEQSLVMLLAMIEEITSGPYDDDEFELVYTKEGRKTLGRLIDAVRARLQMPEDTNEQLKKALDARNYLVHKLFQESWELFKTPDGRSQIRKVVAEKRAEIRSGYAIIDPIVVRILKARGIDVDELTRNTNETFE